MSGSIRSIRFKKIIYFRSFEVVQFDHGHARHVQKAQSTRSAVLGSRARLQGSISRSRPRCSKSSPTYMDRILAVAETLPPCTNITWSRARSSYLLMGTTRCLRRNDACQALCCCHSGDPAGRNLSRCKVLVRITSLSFCCSFPTTPLRAADAKPISREVSSDK